MRPEDAPRLDAYSLRIQIDEVMPIVTDRAHRDPDHPFTGRVLGKLLTILAVIREQYSSRLILDAEIRALESQQSVPLATAGAELRDAAGTTPADALPSAGAPAPADAPAPAVTPAPDDAPAPDQATGTTTPAPPSSRS